MKSKAWIIGFLIPVALGTWSPASLAASRFIDANVEDLRAVGWPLDDDLNFTGHQGGALLAIDSFKDPVILPADRLQALQAINIDYSVTKSQILSWLSNEFSQYPQFAEGTLQLLGGKRLKKNVYLDVIFWNYRELGGKINSNSPDGSLDTEILKKAILEGYITRNGGNILSFEDIVNDSFTIRFYRAENIGTSQQPLSVSGNSPSSGNISNSEDIGTSQQPLSVLGGTLWSSPNIPVCWENPGYATEKGWVRQAVSTTWETASAVRFIGWGQCQSKDRGIRIQVADEQPHTDKALGNQLDGKSNGMVLNFTFAIWTGHKDGKEYCQDGGRIPSGFNSSNRIASATEREYCIKIIAVHEFGHALGMAHEHNREDRIPCDKEPQGPTGDWNITPYDLTSVMNYCNPNWNGNGQLSALDQIGVNILYGKGTQSVQGTSPTLTYYQYSDSQQLENFFVNQEGALSVLWKINNSVWKGPVPITPNNLLPKNAKIASANYPPDNQLENFFVGNDGAVYVSWKANNGVWNSPARLTEPNKVKAGGNLSAVYYPENEQLEVFFVDTQGALNVMWKAKGTGWFSPVKLTGNYFAPTGAGITSVFYPLNNQLEVLFIGNDGAVYLTWKANNGNWNAPVPLTPANTATPGTPISAVYYPPNNQLEAFFIDGSGAFNLIWKAQNGSWNAPVKLTGAGFAPLGSNIASVFYPQNNQLEVFLVDNYGSVNLFWKANNSVWNSPVLLTPANFAQPGSSITAAYQPLNSQLEVFFSDKDGFLNLLWKAQNGYWNSPFRI